MAFPPAPVLFIEPYADVVIGNQHWVFHEVSGWGEKLKATIRDRSTSGFVTVEQWDKSRVNAFLCSATKLQEECSRNGDGTWAVAHANSEEANAVIAKMITEGNQAAILPWFLGAGLLALLVLVLGTAIGLIDPSLICR